MGFGLRAPPQARGQGNLKGAKPEAVRFVSFAYVYVGRATRGSASSPASHGTWGGHTNRAPPSENQHQAVGSLHSFAITALALGAPGTVVSFISAFPAWLGGINQTKKSLWIQITHSSPKVGCLFSLSLPEDT